MTDQNIELSETLDNISKKLLSRKQFLVTAESCTGGGIAAAITDLAGSSRWFDGAFVTYSNESKVAMLDISLGILVQNGAVSEATVTAMAQAALYKSKASISVAVSGIAGPGGGTAIKPVGTVWFAWADKNGYLKSENQWFDGDRAAVRAQTIKHALLGVEQLLNKK